MPTAIIGDCDSMSQEFLTAHRDIIYKVDEQDYNDLTKRHASAQSVDAAALLTSELRASARTTH